MTGLVSNPVQASVPAPGNGYYGCETGDLESSTLVPGAKRFQISGGIVVRAIGCDGSVVVPAGVTAIGDGSFDSSALTSISIPESVTRIGQNAFYGASGLTSISLPSSLTNIGDRAFSNATSLVSISLPVGLTTIGASAFEVTALTSITIPEGVTSLPSFVFSNARALTSVSIPSSVASIDRNTFDGATALTNIAVASNSQSFRSIDGVLFSKDAKVLLDYPLGKSATSYSIPEGVTSIGDSAFDYVTSLTSIIIPEGVTSIGDSAFAAAASITSITIPSSVASIDNYAFSEATLLAHINIPDGVTSIGEYAFTYTSLTSITIPSSITSIGFGAFEDTITLKDIYFLGNAPFVDEYAFFGVANGATAHISANATGFGTESPWNGLEIDRSVSVPTYTVSYNTAGGSSVNSGSFTAGGTIQSAPVSTRTGYTFSGWSTALGGRVVTFPYSPGVTNNITLFAIWTPKKVPAKTATISYSAKFSAGSSVLSATAKKEIKKIVKKAGKNAKYTVTGVASKSTGVSNSKVKARANTRAASVKAYLIKLGVKKSNITTKIAIVTSGITPKTKILARYSVS
jgi:uncharacterized repeat protein (TIGR02543 family)